MHKNLALVLGAVALSLPPWAAKTAVAQSQATLRVEVQPEAQITAPSSLAWAADAATVQMPLNVKLRLHRGTSAGLTIDRTDQSEASLEVGSATGFQAVSAAPVTVRSYAQSGSYGDSLVLRLASPPSTDYEVSLRLRLRSNDGSLEQLHTIQLQIRQSLVSQASVAPAP